LSFVTKGNDSMQRLFALVLIVCLWLGMAPPASADVAGLVPCGETPAFQQRLNNSVRGQEARLQKYDSNSDSAAMIKGRIERTRERFARYEGMLCGPEGLPRLITDGRPSHWSDFQYPGLLFLYLAGWLGWAGRSYIRAVKKSEYPEYSEIQINVPLAIQCFIGALLWPLAAVKEFLSGELIEKEENIPVSPR
jgi:photosystem I subunit 3